MSEHVCTYLGCDQPPVKRTRGTWDVLWWYGCAEHIDAMVKAMYVGNNAKVLVEGVW